MARIKLLTVSESVSVDQFSNTVSLFGLIDSATVLGFPFFIPKVMVMALVRFEDNDPKVVEFVLRVRHAEQELMRGLITAEHEDKPAQRVFVGLGGIVVPSPGMLAFEVLKGEELVASYEVGFSLANPTLFPPQNVFTRTSVAGSKATQPTPPGQSVQVQQTAAGGTDQR